MYMYIQKDTCMYNVHAHVYIYTQYVLCKHIDTIAMVTGLCLLPQDSGRCVCKEGYGGQRCDLCEDGFWRPSTGVCRRKPTQ